MEKDIITLGIESSCDETAASIVKNGRIILSNIVKQTVSKETSDKLKKYMKNMEELYRK